MDIYYISFEDLFGSYPYYGEISFRELINKINGIASAELHVESNEEIVIGLDMDTETGIICGISLSKRRIKNVNHYGN